MGQLLAFIEENWKTIASLPGSVWFILITLLIGVGALMWRGLQMIAKGQIDGLTGSISSLTERVKHRDDEIARLKERAAEIQTSAANQRDGRIEALEAQIKGQDEQIKAQAAEIGEYDGRIAALEAEVKSREEKISTLEVEAFDRDVELSQIEKKFKAAVEELQSAKSRSVKVPLPIPMVEAPTMPKRALRKPPTPSMAAVLKAHGFEEKRATTPSIPVEPLSVLRGLNPRQIHTLTEGLSGPGGQIVLATRAGADPHGTIRTDLRKAFGDAGWQVIMGHIGRGDRARTALALCVNDPENLTLRQKGVSDALRDADIPYEIVRVVSEVEVSIWIREQGD